MKEKVSAFAIFKGRKASSLTNVTQATPNNTSKKSSSANTTPTNKNKGLSAIINKITNTDTKKKAEIKRAKKLLKSASISERSSRVSSAVLESPVLGNLSNSAMRPKTNKGSNYTLPLKATPDINSSKMGDSGGISKKSLKTPPLPPRQPRRNASVSSQLSQDFTKLKKRRLPSKSGLPAARASDPSHSTPGTEPLSQSIASKSEAEPPSQPAKRRRVSQNSACSSPRQALYTSPANSVKQQDSSVSMVSERRSSQRGLPYMFDSQHEAKKLFDCLIHPVKATKFFSELWEKKPLLVKRHMENYNDGWLSTAELDRILREHKLDFTVNLDVVSYVNGKRETHNPPGRAYAPVVWDYYQNGCSVRVLNPQTYSHNIWKLLSILQEYFGCCVGANVYLTPPGTQGFAPHYDDIEAFILQLEGKKHWRLYSPRTESETLPRYSSNNFTDEDLGKPILDVILEAGDLLYFPRGTIHQGKTLEGAHSLHITVSCMQRNSWGDLLEQLVPRALQIATEEDLEFRQALPKDYLNYMGVAFSDKDCPERQQFLRTVERLMRKMLTSAPVDATCDQMGKKFIHDSLPPVLTEIEKRCSTHGNGEHWQPDEKRVVGAVEVEPDTEIKLIRKGCIRLVSESEDRVLIYHNLENARLYHGTELQCIEITAELAPAVEFLLHKYPEFVTVDELPLENIQDKVEVASALYDKGLVITSTPLQPISDDEESEEEEEEGGSPVRTTTVSEL